MVKNKKQFKRKVRKDKKQDKRIKSLEKFVYKTIENKQVDYGYQDTGRTVSTSGDQRSQFLGVATGAQDGSAINDPARVGNSISLMRQQISLTFEQSSDATITADDYNRMRVIIAESTEGNENLELSDVLEYSNYGTHGGLVFSSPYTTKTSTNKRYKIHSDMTFELNKNATSATKIIKKVIKFREGGSPGKVVSFADATAQYPTNHRLNIMCISDSSVAPHPRWFYNVRSTYKDA